MEVRLCDCMRENFRFIISDNFRINLFEKAIQTTEGVINLSKFLGCDRNQIKIMEKGKVRFIRWQIIKKLIEITNISESDLEKNVLAVKAGKSGRITWIKFPIKESSELALLIAKGVGDGTIEKNFRFAFWNKNESLINEVCEFVKRSIGNTKVTITKLKDGRIQAKFTSFVGFVLNFFGVPVGDKTQQEFDVPEWIKNGSKEIKTSFIRGLFDDEGSVQLWKRTRRIIISFSKLERKKESLEAFLNSLKIILFEFGIKSTPIRKQMSFKNENGDKKVMLQFSISQTGSLKLFLDSIGFTSEPKLFKLNEIVQRFSKPYQLLSQKNFSSLEFEKLN